MNREIKFRAWDKYDKIFKYFTMHPQHIDIGFNIYHKDIRDADENVVGEFYPNLDDWNQFTGLKDKNDREIYEGDIVNAEYAILTVYPNHINIPNGKWHEINGEILFKEGAFWVKGDTLVKTFDIIEVIGNIYENPELL